MSTQKKRINAPVSLAVGMIIVAVVGLIAIGFYIGSQGSQHAKMPRTDSLKSTSQAVDIDQLREELTQGRIDG